MNKTVLNITDVQSESSLQLEKVVSFSVLNDGERNVYINDILIKKNERFDFFQPDGSVCDLDLKISFPDQKNIYADLGTNKIVFNDTLGNEAVFFDGVLGGNMYNVKLSKNGNQFKFIRVNTVDEFLTDFSYVLTRQGDNKIFVATRCPENDDYYYISNYMELEYKEGDTNLSNKSIIPLFSMPTYYEGFRKQNVKLIYKKLI